MEQKALGLSVGGTIFAIRVNECKNNYLTGYGKCGSQPLFRMEVNKIFISFYIVDNDNKSHNYYLSINN